MAKERRRKSSDEDGFLGLGGFLGGLSTFLEKLGELAETGGEIRKSGELHGLGPEGKVRGVYGFTIKTGLGEERVEVEPFGNLRRDEKTGRAVVQETREPMVDVFQEEDCVLVVAEMPGVTEDDVTLDLTEDILSIVAERGDKRYRKEVLLPRTFSPPQMSHTCRNGILEVRLAK